MTVDWEYLGVRLAMSTLPTVARAIEIQFGHRVEVSTVGDFTGPELRKYLELHEQRWGDLAPDVRGILRRPLLAKIFCDVAQSGLRTPTTEYELFQRFWLRIRDARNQADYPRDTDAVRSLAGTVVDQSSPYPWPSSTLDNLNISGETQRRLESIGWLRRLEDGRVEIAHDRLLNWAVAEALVARLQAGTNSISDLGTTLIKLMGWQARFSGRYLGYVPMDVLWQLAEPARGLIEVVPELLATMEQLRSGGSLDILYKSQLPTLGRRIILPMTARVRATTEHPYNPYPGLVANAVLQIHQSEPELSAGLALQWLADDTSAMRDTGVRILSNAPTAAALDPLWELHKSNVIRFQDKVGEGYWQPYQRSFSALQSCVRMDPQWLLRRVEQIDPSTEPAWELGYLIATLEGSRGREVWRHAKEALFACIPTNHVRCLARCIEQHADIEEVSRLESWLGERENLGGSAALKALARVAPARAIAGLGRLEPGELYVTRGSWLRELMLRCPKETREAIRRLMSAPSSVPWQVALVYQGAEDLMDERTLDLLLDELDRLSTTCMTDMPTARRLVGRPLDSLAAISRLSLLERFAARAATTLDVNLRHVATSWIANADSFVDHDLQNAAKVLLKINGQGFTDLINDNLSSQNRYSHLFGIKWACARPNSMTRTLLRQLAMSETLYDDKSPWIQSEASVALAALGENEAVIAYVLKFGQVLSKLADVRADQAAMTDTDVATALVALNSDDESTRTKGVWAIRLSGRSDLSTDVRRALRKASPESELTRAAVIALDALQDRHPDAIELFSKQLDVSSHTHVANLALLRNGSAAALVILEQVLRRTGLASGGIEQQMLAINLSRRPATRMAVAEIVWDAIREQWPPNIDDELLCCVAELNTPDVREFLIDEAYSADGDGPTVGRRLPAIRALSIIDPDGAFQACQSTLEAARKDRQMLPSCLMKIDQARASQALCNCAVTEQSSLALWATGRALRRLHGSNPFQGRILKMLRSEDALERRAAAEISGWQPANSFGEDLKSLALGDNSLDVRRSAARAIERQQTEEHVIELLNALREGTENRRWSLSEAILDLADPLLLASRNDSLWLGHFLPSNCVYLWQHIEQLIRRKIEELESESKRHDREL